MWFRTRKRFATEAQFVAADDLGRDFADGVVAAVECAEVIRADTECRPLPDVLSSGGAFKG